MGVVDDLIGSYFCINRRIGKTLERNRIRRKVFYNQTLVTHSGFRDEQPATISFNVENEVVNHVAALQIAEQHIKILEFKQRYFKRFLNGLDTNSKSYYEARYVYDLPTINERLDKLIYDEVSEIEEAAVHCFKQNDKQEIYIVDPNKTDEEKFTDFSKMLELLEV